MEAPAGVRLVLTWIGWKVLFKLGPRGQTIMLTVVTVAVLSMLIGAVQHEWILFACVAGWIAACVSRGIAVTRRR
jgi:hypothetical protein